MVSFMHDVFLTLTFRLTMAIQAAATQTTASPPVSVEAPLVDLPA